MICRRLILAGLLIAALGVSVATTCRDASAGDYVWTRSAWGNGNWGRNYGGVANGYGGYYIQRNGYGNNFESRRPFTNPNGYIVPDDGGGRLDTRQQAVSSGSISPTFVRRGRQLR